MAIFGVFFDYRKFNRRAWLFCALMFVIGVFFMGISSIAYDYYEDDYSILSIIDFYSYTSLQFIMCTPSTLLYIVLMRTLHERLVVLNSLLRFDVSSTQFYRLNHEWYQRFSESQWAVEKRIQLTPSNLLDTNTASWLT